MLGAVIGDIVGSRFEFDDWKSKTFNLFGGNGIRNIECEYTDDTVMTAAVAEALLQRTPGEDDETLKRRLVERMRYHGRKRMNAGFGPQFYRWLKSADAGPYQSCGNGSAMRAAPAGRAADTLEEAEHLAKLTAEVTHDHPEGIRGAQAVAAAVFLAREGRTKEEIRRYIETRYYPDAFRKTLEELRPDYEYDATCQGTVPPAPEAFYEAESFENALRNAVSLGGDSDTLTDINGAVVEAYFGIPEEIAAKALTFLDDELLEIVRQFRARYG